MYTLDEVSKAARLNGARAAPPHTHDSLKQRAIVHLNAIRQCFPDQLEHVEHNPISDRVHFVFDYLALLSSSPETAYSLQCLYVCFGLRECEDYPMLPLTPTHCAAVETRELKRDDSLYVLDPHFALNKGIEKYKHLLSSPVCPVLLVCICIAHSDQHIVFTNVLLYSTPVVDAIIRPLNWSAWSDARLQCVRKIAPADALHEWRHAPVDVQISMCEIDELVRRCMVTRLCICARCFAVGFKMRACAACQQTTYCSERCQRAHWTAAHKIACTRVAAIAKGKPMPETEEVIKSPLFELD